MSALANSPPAVVVEIQGVSRNFGSKAALRDVRLSVPRGGVFGLIGENGAGKTTLIKHVLGLLRPETGSVRLRRRPGCRSCRGAVADRLLVPRA